MCRVISRAWRDILWDAIKKDVSGKCVIMSSLTVLPDEVDNEKWSKLGVVEKAALPRAPAHNQKYAERKDGLKLNTE